MLETDDDGGAESVSAANRDGAMACKEMKAKLEEHAHAFACMHVASESESIYA